MGWDGVRWDEMRWNRVGEGEGGGGGGGEGGVEGGRGAAAPANAIHWVGAVAFGALAFGTPPAATATTRSKSRAKLDGCTQGTLMWG